MSGSTATAPATSCLILYHYSGMNRGRRGEGGAGEVEGKQRQKSLFLSVFFPNDLQDQPLRPRRTGLFWFKLASGDRAAVGHPRTDAHDGRHTGVSVRTLRPVAPRHFVGSLSPSCAMLLSSCTSSSPPPHPPMYQTVPPPAVILCVFF